MSFRTYLWMTLGLISLEAVMFSMAYVGIFDYLALARISLGTKLSLDFVFIILNIRLLELKRFELLMLSMLLWSTTLGGIQLISGNLQYDFWRILKDVLPVSAFFLKMGVLRALIRTAGNFVPIIVIISSVSSVIGLIVFNALGGYSTGYIGLTPPVSVLAAYALSIQSPLLFLLAGFIVFASGKRSFLISLIVGFVFELFNVTRKRGRTEKQFRFGIAICITFFVALGSRLIYENAMSDKFLYTMTSLQESGVVDRTTSTLKQTGVATDFDLLDAASGGRLREVTSVTSEMNAIDWVLGTGAGFTYTLGVYENLVFDRYANTHFSPLSMTYKFGLPFAVMFYWWILAIAHGIRRNDWNTEFWRLLLVLYMVQSLFAYNLFVEPLLPVALACIQSVGTSSRLPFKHGATIPRGPVRLGWTTSRLDQ